MNKLIALTTALVVCAASAQTPTDSYADRPEAKALIAELQAQYDLDPAWVRAQLAAAERQPDILHAMRTPAEKTLAWYQYRRIFLDQKRIKGGAAFIRAHADILQRAVEQFGVPAPVIAAIIGVETRYGQITGDDRVLDALATLGFDYPPRADFFRSELGEFLALAKEENLDPQAVLGSYAGAMGMAQFIPSSYRAYTVDFNHNGQRDLWDEPADAIGSVANYLAVHGWQRGEPIILRSAADVIPERIELSRRETRYSYRELTQAGISTKEPQQLPADTPVGLVALEAETGPQYWIGLKNFFVITDYNHSPLYAMAVYQLSQAIAGRLETSDGVAAR